MWVNLDTHPWKPIFVFTLDIRRSCNKSQYSFTSSPFNIKKAHCTVRAPYPSLRNYDMQRMLPFYFTIHCAVLQFYARRFICRDFTGTTTTFIPKPFVRGVDSVKKEQFTPFLTWGYSRRHFLNVSTYSSHFSSLSQSFQSFCQVNYYGPILQCSGYFLSRCLSPFLS